MLFGGRGRLQLSHVCCAIVFMDSFHCIILLFSCMQSRNQQLTKTMEGFDLPEEAKKHEDEDLLDLLDAACSKK